MGRVGVALVLWTGMVSGAAAQETGDALADADADEAVAVRVRAERPTYALAYQSGTSYRSNTLSAAVVDLYERVCMAPCEAELPAGEYRFAVEHRGSYYPAGGRWQLDEPSDFHLSIHRPRLQRAFGVLLLLGGLVAGGVFFGRILARRDEERGETFARDAGLGSAGLGLALIGVLTLSFAETRAHIGIGPRD